MRSNSGVTMWHIYQLPRVNRVVLYLGCPIQKPSIFPQKLANMPPMSWLASGFLIRRNLRIAPSILRGSPAPLHNINLPIQPYTSFLNFSKPSKAGTSLHSFPGILSEKAPAIWGRLRSNHSMAGQSQSIFDFTVEDAQGNDVNLSKYRGKVLLIVNVASQCGLTNSNYTQLTKLYEQYKDQGLEILAFPCNQFGSQEPGTNNEIQEFACTRFKAEYPVFGKINVNGSTADPLYKYLKSAKGGIFGDSIKWNFTKFLVDREGNVINRYAPTTSPSSIEKDIKKLLEKA